MLIDDEVNKLKFLDRHMNEKSTLMESVHRQEVDSIFDFYYLPIEKFGKMINIQIISNCNLHCSFCRGGMDKNDLNYLSKTKTMDTQKFISIVDKCTSDGIEFFELTPAIGEPMLDKEIFNKLDYLEENPKVKEYLFTTNFVKVTIEDMIKFASYKKILFTISVYGHDIESYKKATNRDNFEKFYMNLRAFYEILKKVGLSFKIEFTMRTGEEYGPDFSNQDLYYTLKAFTFLGNCRINNGELKNINRGGSIQSIEVKDKKRSGVCIHGPGVGGGITQTGDVLFCPFNDINRKGVMGNIFEKSLKEIYNGDRWKSIIDKHTNNIYDGICEKCNETW